MQAIGDRNRVTVRTELMAETPAAAPIIVWFRRCLRLADHPALAAAVATGRPIVPAFVLDDDTPGAWKTGAASRWWLANSLRSLSADLLGMGSRLILRRGEAVAEIVRLANETGAAAVYFTRGYEPFQPAVEDRLKTRLASTGIEARRFGGQVLFEPEALSPKSGGAFRVFTPFYKAAFARGLPRTPLPAPLSLALPPVWPVSDRVENWRLEPAGPDWASGFRAAWTVGEAAAAKRLDLFVANMLHVYRSGRNLPGTDGTSRLSPHLAFGEIGPHRIWHAIDAVAKKSGDAATAEPYLKEIIWREFSYHLLFHFPSLPEKAFKAEFDAFPWMDDKAGLRAWQKGRTGYPIVDAGMRQLWQTGWMHNRVRMITASFLIKHLLVQWQTGQAWFWDTLVDADLASNAASWQWVAGSGADAAPYFRIFNPVLQGEKFDPKGEYVRAYCPELARLPDSLIHKPWEADGDLLARAHVTLGITYPEPIVGHSIARKRALAALETIKIAR